MTVRRARIWFAGRTAISDRLGRAQLSVKLRRGRYRARASKRGYNGASAYVRAVHARHTRLRVLPDAKIAIGWRYVKSQHR